VSGRASDLAPPTSRRSTTEAAGRTSRRGAANAPAEGRPAVADDSALDEALQPAAESRPKVRSIGFAALALLGVALCAYVAFPLFAPILWAAVFAVVARPLHRRAERRFGRPSLAAALVTGLVALLVALPAAFVATELLLEVSDAIMRQKTGDAARLWQQFLGRHPQLAALVEGVARRVDLEALVGQVTGGASRLLRAMASGSIAAATGWLIMIFILFFFLRDRARVLAAVERFLPLSAAETRELFKTADDTIQATVWGVVGVGVLQGTLGALVFWWLELPAPLLWGAVMAVLSVLPVLGAAIVWLPVAAFLALQGNWTDALILTGFGSVIIGLVDNLVYPLIVKDRIRLHAVPVFISIIGGLVVFGLSGIVLGPLLLALTDTLVGQWRQRLGIGGDPAPE
jgi:predicted PurR-regulated permease PerM